MTLKQYNMMLDLLINIDLYDMRDVNAFFDEVAALGAAKTADYIGTQVLQGHDIDRSVVGDKLERDAHGL